MLRFLHQATYLPGQLHTRWAPSSRHIVPEVEAAIEVAWQQTLARPGVRLFDGALCRYEGLHVDGGQMTIDLSRTSYRVVVGTNFINPQFADAYGIEVMANPVGVSTGLITSDNYIMMGRRNRTVAYYPDRVHPFAGSLEVEETIDLFGNVRRELREELGLELSQVTQIRCLGLAEDYRLRHPETIYVADTSLTRKQIDAQVDKDEHHDAWAIPATAAEIAGALKTHDMLTPIACAVLLAYGREQFGEAWFDDHAEPLLSQD